MGKYPSYWQDPAFPEQWEQQTISNAPPSDWKGPIFRLSDAFPKTLVDQPEAQPWRTPRFAPLFQPQTDRDERSKLALEYGWAVMRYMQEGNINQPGQPDWAVCDNPWRPWYNVPFQTYDPLSGREFTHGLTREAPVTFSLSAAPDGVASTMWAVGLFNQQAAYALGQVWHDGQATAPTKDLSFPEGSVVGKPLFNTASVEQMPILAGLPSWQANISDPTFCRCDPTKAPPKGAKRTGKAAQCTMQQQSQQCPRSTTKYAPVRLLQFDFAVKDSRAPGTQWVYGTFVADGRRKAQEPEPWNRISLLGVMWGNDQPPSGALAHDHPKDPRANGFTQEVIFWDVVDELNSIGGPTQYQRPGHLGCNFRLNGPADNANSSCMSCHGTASRPDDNLATPPLLSQFGSDLTFECVTPDAKQPTNGRDRTQTAAQEQSGITFAQMDSLYFASTPAAAPFDTTVQGPDGPVNVLGAKVPNYPDGLPGRWISLDYSLQLSISLAQWGQWQRHRAQKVAAANRVHTKLPRRSE